jgi:mitochondrial distribution and morphology protein 31
VPLRGIRTLRRGLLPGGLVYNAGRTSEANIERNVATSSASASATSTVSVTSRPTAQSFRTSRSRRISTKDNPPRRPSDEPAKPNSKKQKEEPKPDEVEGDSQSYFRPPTKEQLLASATSFFDRLHIRFKWPLIKSYRPFNMDDFSAFASVYLLSHAFLLFAATTTFFLLVIATINTVGAQEYFARLVGQYLTKESGMTVVFESAIVPKWKEKTIHFEKVFVSRRPAGQQGISSVRKGSSATAAAAAAAAAVAEARHNETIPHDDGNYTQFDLTIDAIDVTLSFVKWINGKGLVENVYMKGVRGVVGMSM